MEMILEKGTARDIWESMRVKFQGSTKVKRAQLHALKCEFEVLAMKESESINDYFARTLSIVNKMTAQGQRMEALDVVEKILRSLTPRFNYVVCSIKQSNDVLALSIDELQNSLIVQEQRMKFQSDKYDEQVLKVTGGGRGERGRGRGGARGRGRGRQNSSKENVECYKCHKLGHYQSECPSWGEQDPNVNYAEFNEHEEVLLMTKQDATIQAKIEVWYLDSGCSNHMIGNKEWLFNFDDAFRESVKLGDDSKMHVMGKGKLKLYIGGITQVMSEVYYLSGLKNNLLSIGQLQQKNLTIVFKNDTCKVFHEERGLIMSTQMSANRMYVINATVFVPMRLQTTDEIDSQLWHKRYGHLSYKGLSTLVKKEMVKGLPALKEAIDVCSDCLFGKQHREVIPKKVNWRATHKLELDKAGAFESFKKFKAVAEKESGCQILSLRTDKGGEFMSEAFNKFCTEQGIKRQLATTYTPQQNGVSERKNMIIMNMVRCMLNDKKVPKKFWPECVKWDVAPEEA
ncbi:copia-type polyprotein [Trifolium pratense]|uniref:Copia-type polyprotein n=1 Tax=Trifolium pratense TaxID=57577 RepID=A0A2K3LQN7_TRIPR|nr:copia-type polyprotein [Trifolium pratense]